MRIGLTLLRYFLGAALLFALIAGGLALRIVQFSQPNDDATGNVILVMGAAQYNGRPSPVFEARLDHAADLYHAARAPHIMTVGGGQVGDAVTEGEAGRRYLVDHGIPADDVTGVGIGSDTLISLRAAAREIHAHGWTSVVIVTDPWHEERCRMIARDLGLSVQVSPVTEGPATTDSVRSSYLWRELLGTLFYRLVGGSSGAGTPVI